MSASWLWIALLGCGTKAEPEPVAEPVVEQAAEPDATAEQTAAVVATPAQEAMYKALSVRDDGPTCTEVEAMSEDPVGDLVWLTEHATSPPWVGTRAATCLIAGHGEAIADLLRTWVTDPATLGYGWTVLGNLGLLPTALAVELAQLALTDGPDPDGARERIARHDDPALQALLQD